MYQCDVSCNLANHGGNRKCVNVAAQPLADVRTQQELHLFPFFVLFSLVCLSMKHLDFSCFIHAQRALNCGEGNPRIRNIKYLKNRNIALWNVEFSEILLIFLKCWWVPWNVFWNVEVFEMLRFLKCCCVLTIRAAVWKSLNVMKIIHWMNFSIINLKKHECSKAIFICTWIFVEINILFAEWIKSRMLGVFTLII